MTDLAPLDAALRARLATLDAAALCDGAGGAGIAVGVMDPGIRLMTEGVPMAGVARPVLCDRDFLAVVQALDASAPGEVLVVAAADIAVSGELFAAEAERRGLGGIVIDGWCRDTAILRGMAFPLYARGSTPRAGRLMAPRDPAALVNAGGVTVAAGDLVFGDRDGVIVVPAARVAEAVEAAEAVQRREAAVLAAIRAGRSLIDQTNLREHVAALREGRESAFRLG